MSRFSDCFAEIKEKRNLTSVEIAEICGLEKTMVFQWMVGKYLPSTWKKISGVLGALRLTSYEYERLQEAYEREKLGDDTYEGIQKVISIMHTLKEKINTTDRNIMPLCYKVIEYDNHMETIELNNYLDVLQCIQNILSVSAVQRENSIFLKVDAISEQFSVLLDLLLSEKQVNIYNGEFHNKEQMKENWLLSDDFVMQFSEDMSQGLFSRDADYIAFIKEKYAKIKGKCKKLFNKSVNMQEDINRIRGTDATLYCMEYVPCISIGLTAQILDRCIYDEIAEKDFIIGQLINTFVNNDTIHVIYNFFNEQGLYRFLESGKFDNFPHDIYESIIFEDRCEIVRNAVSGKMSNIEMHYFRVKNDAFLNMENVYVE